MNGKEIFLKGVKKMCGGENEIAVALSSGKDSTKIEKSVIQFLKKIGKKGGRNRAKKLSPERRREIALLAINTRWKDKKKILDS